MLPRPHYFPGIPLARSPASCAEAQQRDGEPPTWLPSLLAWADVVPQADRGQLRVFAQGISSQSTAVSVHGQELAEARDLVGQRLHQACRAAAAERHARVQLEWRRQVLVRLPQQRRGAGCSGSHAGAERGAVRGKWSLE